jgi:hypothetical protein
VKVISKYTSALGLLVGLLLCAGPAGAWTNSVRVRTTDQLISRPNEHMNPPKRDRRVDRRGAEPIDRHEFIVSRDGGCVGARG